MAIWLIRAGKHGEREDIALQKGWAVIGWEELPDLSTVNTREELSQLMKATYPNEASKTLINWVGQVWAFRDRVQLNDFVVLPLKTRSAIAIGKVEGPYKHTIVNDEGLHTRQVRWIKTDLPRSPSLFGQDLLHSLGAAMTVCQIQRNNAEARIKAIAEGKPVPAPAISTTDNTTAEEDAVATDISEYAEDRIRAHIERNFSGHALARLVDALLKATGYVTIASPPGPDGGIDIVAGRGPMGFDPPRLCVQVKSSSSPVNVEILQRLHGSMVKVKAEQGLLVAWGGFNSKVPAEARDQFFSVRLWDSGDLIKAILDNYEKLSPEIQTELPLKRIWILVENEPEMG